VVFCLAPAAQLWREGRFAVLTPAIISRQRSILLSEPSPDDHTRGSTSGSTTAEGTASSTTANGAASTAAAPTAAAPDAAVVQEIKQLLASLISRPAPSTAIDQATQDAIRSYQEMAGRPSMEAEPGLLNDLRVVVAYQQPPG
jgi:hypothetical protein